MISFRQADLLDTVNQNAPRDRYMELRIYSNKINFVFGPIDNIDPRPIMEFFIREVLGNNVVMDSPYAYQWQSYDVSGKESQSVSMAISTLLSQKGIGLSKVHSQGMVKKYMLNNYDIAKIS